MTEAIIKGLGLGLILMLSVGPVIFAIIKQSINNGQPGGFSFVAGVWVSDLILVVLSNMFTEVVSRILHFSDEIAYGGGGFLILMGIYYVFFKKVDFGRDDLSNLPPFNKRRHSNSDGRLFGQHIEPQHFSILVDQCDSPGCDS